MTLASRPGRHPYTTQLRFCRDSSMNSRMAQTASATYRIRAVAVPQAMTKPIRRLSYGVVAGDAPAVMRSRWPDSAMERCWSVCIRGTDVSVATTSPALTRSSTEHSRRVSRPQQRSGIGGSKEGAARTLQ